MKKGFTLIELLAVIVILAIIAIIAIPIITNVIDKAKQGAFKDSVLNAYSSVEYKLLEMKTKEIPPEGIDVKDLKIKSDFVSGKFMKDEQGKVIAYFIKNDEYCAYGRMDDLIIAKDCSDLDTTGPTASASITETTSKTVKIAAVCSDTESGITKIEYSKDNGSTFIDNGTTATYTFTGLTTGTYNIKVRCTNGKGTKTTSESVSGTTTSIAVPTYSVSPEGWTYKNKTVTINYPTGYTNEYSLDSGETWKQYTTAVTFTDNGSVIARVSDGTNYVSGSSQSVSGIDKTGPSATAIVTNKTSNQIDVKAVCSDSESGIKWIGFSKNGGGKAIIPPNTTTYSFKELTTGTYEILIKCMNGAGKIVDSQSVSTTTTSIAVPTYTVSPAGYTSGNKTVTINYPSGYTNEYSVDGGTTWNSYTGPVTFTDNGSIIARVNDGTNYVSGSSQTVTGIDKTGPSASANIIETTSKTIKIDAVCSDSESGITKIEYSKDNGTTFVDNGTTATYTFTGLTTGTYNIKVRCTNGAGIKTTSDAVSQPVISLPSGLTKGTAVYMNPETANVCTESDYTNNTSASKTGNKLGCMKWYIYKDNGNETYQLILDHNTTGAVKWSAASSQLASDISEWHTIINENNARLITAYEVAEITGNTTFNGTGSSWFYFVTNSGYTISTCEEGSTSRCIFRWLYDRTANMCTTFGCLNNADVNIGGYWTSTRVSDSIYTAWIVCFNGTLRDLDMSTYNHSGVRPVVTF